MSEVSLTHTTSQRRWVLERCDPDLRAQNWYMCFHGLDLQGGKVWKPWSYAQNVHLWTSVLFILFLGMASQVAQGLRIYLSMQEMQETQLWSLGQEDPLEEGMATHPSILAWRSPWTEEPGGIQSMGSKRVRHDWAHTLMGVGRGSVTVYDFEGGLQGFHHMVWIGSARIQLPIVSHLPNGGLKLMLHFLFRRQTYWARSFSLKTQHCCPNLWKICQVRKITFIRSQLILCISQCRTLLKERDGPSQVKNKNPGLFLTVC